MKALPKMGRPSETGLSIKELGEVEYRRQWSRLFVKRKTKRRWHTGLSRKLLGGTEYRRQYRAMKTNKQKG